MKTLVIIKQLPPLSKVLYIKTLVIIKQTTSIIKGYVWKPPDISKSYSKPKRGQEKFNMASPRLTLFHHLGKKIYFLFFRFCDFMLLFYCDLSHRPGFNFSSRNYHNFDSQLLSVLLNMTVERRIKSRH